MERGSYGSGLLSGRARREGTRCGGGASARAILILAAAVAATLLLAGTSSAQNPTRTDRRTYDMGESLRVGGRDIRMLRLLDELAIIRADNQEAAVPAMGEAIRVQDKTFRVQHRISRLGATILSVETPQSADTALESMQDLAVQTSDGRIVPIYIHEESGLEMIPTGDIIVELAPGYMEDSLYEIGEQFAVAVKRRLRGTADQFILAVSHDDAEELFDLCLVLENEPAIQWAEPDFIGRISKCDIWLNDPFFGTDQWHLGNIKVPKAWETTTGSEQIVIAVIDDGVDIDHEDLQANIFQNADPINGTDDDGNGWLDDLNGWNFWDDDEDPRPGDRDDNHGTAVAGVAAAVGNNHTGVAGCAQGCKLMPLKMAKGDPASWTEGDLWIFYRAIPEAIRYAAGQTADGLGQWRGADIISISWGFSQTTAIDSAIEYATESGRGGKGCPVFCSSGNLASGYVPVTLPTDDLPAGQYRVDFIYAKDAAGTSGEDAVWIANVVLPDSAETRECFDSSSMPSGWEAWGNNGFRIVDDPSHAYGTGRYVVKSGSIGNSQMSGLTSRSFSLKPGKPLTLDVWVSTEKGANPLFSFPPSGNDGDWFFVQIWRTATGYGPMWKLEAGVPGDRWYVSGRSVQSGIGYPASHPDTIAVGASTDMGYRADYSQHGYGLDFVVPSSGGLGAITTTDRTGAAGYNKNVNDHGGNYTWTFGGTSASAPLAAGVGALMLSANPDLRADDLRTIMEQTCVPIGNVPYDATGWSTYYGYGCIDAAAAVNLALLR